MKVILSKTKKAGTIALPNFKISQTAWNQHENKHINQWMFVKWDLTQGLTLDRQVLYHLSMPPAPRSCCTTKEAVNRVDSLHNRRFTRPELGGHETMCFFPLVLHRTFQHSQLRIQRITFCSSHHDSFQCQPWTGTLPAFVRHPSTCSYLPGGAWRTTFLMHKPLTVMTNRPTFGSLSPEHVSVSVFPIQ
jgi:hypothetical protein